MRKKILGVALTVIGLGINPSTAEAGGLLRRRICAPAPACSSFPGYYTAPGCYEQMMVPGAPCYSGGVPVIPMTTKETTSDLSELAKKVQDLQTTVTALNTELGKVQKDTAQITALKKQIEEIQKGITALLMKKSESPSKE